MSKMFCPKCENEVQEVDVSFFSGIKAWVCKPCKKEVVPLRPWELNLKARNVKITQSIEDGDTLEINEQRNAEITFANGILTLKSEISPELVQKFKDSFDSQMKEYYARIYTSCDYSKEGDKTLVNYTSRAKGEF